MKHMKTPPPPPQLPPYQNHTCPFRHCVCKGTFPKRRRITNKRGRFYKSPAFKTMHQKFSGAQRGRIRAAYHSFTSTSKSPQSSFSAKQPFQMVRPLNLAPTFYQQGNNMKKQLTTFQLPIYLENSSSQLGYLTVTATSGTNASLSCPVSDKTSAKTILKSLSSLENVKKTNKGIHVGIPKSSINWTVNLKEPKIEISPSKYFKAPLPVTEGLLDGSSLTFQQNKLKSAVDNTQSVVNTNKLILEQSLQQKIKDAEENLTNRIKTSDFCKKTLELEQRLKNYFKEKAFKEMVEDIYQFRLLYPTLPEWTLIPTYVACNGDFLMSVIELQNILNGKTEFLKKKFEEYCKSYIERHSPK